MPSSEEHFHPPRLPSKLLRLAIGSEAHADSILGDLAEDYAAHLSVTSRRVARARYWRQALSLLLYYTRERIRPSSPVDAARAAATRSRRSNIMLDTIVQDIRYAVRRLIKDPGFTGITLLTLALGIGASTAIFSIVHAVLIRPLPYAHPDRLVSISERDPEGDRMSLAWPNYLDIKERSRAYDDIAAYMTNTFNLTDVDQPERLIGRNVSWNFFKILGVQPQLGRSFTPDDDRMGTAKTALITDALWKRRFGGGAGIIGKAIKLNGAPYTVIGVLPASFRFVRADDVYATMGAFLTPDSGLLDRGNHFSLLAVGRLKANVSVKQANDEVVRIAAQLAREHPDTNSGNGGMAQLLRDRIVENVRATLLVLMGAVGFLLLIACVNVANLLVARGATRRHELAVRAALGGGRLRLIRQLLAESALVAFVGAALGVLAAYWLVRVLVTLAPPDIPRMDEVGLNLATLLFAVGAAAMSGLVFGVIPALQASGESGQQLLIRSSRSAAGASMQTRRALMIIEVAMALLLLTGAGLMIRTVVQLTRVDAGFDSANLLTARLILAGTEWDELPRRYAFYDQVLEKLEAIPGVERAAFTLSLPIDGSNWNSIFIVGDKPVPPRAELPSSAFVPVSAGYFEAMGIRVIKGRVFTKADGPGTAKVAVINETFARRLWPGEDPIGKRLKQGWPETPEADSPWREVVGLVADVKLEGVEAETPLQAYLPLTHESARNVAVVVRTRMDPSQVASAAQAAIHAVDKNVPVFAVRSMTQVMNEAIARQWLSVVIMGVFAAVALILAAVGIYGVVAHGVTERTQEIGIRMALGARRGDVLRLFLQQGFLMTAIGMALGLAAALALGRLVESVLFGVTPTDPVTFAAVMATLLAVSIAACYIPARRATRIDPLAALRVEA